MLAAVGSTMNDKYAEGYPGRRYYGGCEFVDVTEQLAIDRAKELFGADHANVQPHAGAQANLAVFGAFLDPRRPEREGPRDGARPRGTPHPRLARERVRACGSTSSATRSTARPSSSTWTWSATSRRSIGRRSILAGYTAYPRTIDFAAFRQIADEVGALLWVDASHFIGLVAGGAYPSPVPHADVVTFTTHKALRGPRGAMIVCREEHAKAIDKAVFPMMQGGPLEHAIAGKAVCLQGGDAPDDFKDYAERTVRDARALAAALADEGSADRLGRDRLAPDARRRPAGRDRRQGGRAGPRRGPDRAQQEPDPVRPEPAVGAVGRAGSGPPPARRSAWTSPRCARSASIIGDVLKTPGDDGDAGEGARARRAT